LRNKIIEVKTGEPASIEEYAFAGQTQLYCLGIMQEYGVDIPEVEYVFIKKPQMRLKKTETLEEFYSRYYQAGCGLEIVRVPVIYEKQSLIETSNYLISVVQNNIQFNPTQNRNECIRFGNKCEYFPYCWPNAFKLPEINIEEEVA
jgi:hypothetical protein